MATRRKIFAWARAALLLLVATRSAAAETNVLTRLREIRALVHDRTRMFSISRTLAELDEIEPKLRDAGPNSPERGELTYLRGFLHYRAQRPELSIPLSLEAIRIDAAAPFLPAPVRLQFTYNVATQAEELKRWPLAIEHFRKALALFPTDPGATEDQKFGTMERLAFCLHEAGQFVEAKGLNEEVLRGGERLHGADGAQLVTVLNNLAQNLYGLGDKPAARPLLERRLRIATTHKDDDVVDDTLFQLGVLAFETGRHGEAEALMKRRLSLAEASRDKDRIKAAKRDLNELYRRPKR